MITLAAITLALTFIPPKEPAPPRPGATPAGAAGELSTRLGARLSALDPADPAGYFRLAEDVADEERSPEGRALARRLLVLAALLPRSAAPATPASEPRRAPEWLAASACLGLAALAEQEQERRWLTALAGTLAPDDGAAGVPARQNEAAARDAAALSLATAIGMVRSGDGRRALRLLENPAVASLLIRYEALLSPGGLSGGGERLRTLAMRSGPCAQCHNRRSIRDADGVRLCPTCQGRPGPKLSVAEVVAQLRLESLLLNGIQRSWAAQIVTDGGAPMRELDPTLLADVYGVDLRRPKWRNGAWEAAMPTVEEPTPEGQKGQNGAEPPG